MFQKLCNLNPFKNRKRTVVIVFMGLMMAIEIIFERLISISTDTMRFSVTFLPRSISGTLFGLPAGLISILADLLGGFIVYGFSINILITLAAGLRGAGYGILLYSKRTPLRIIIAAVFDQFFCGFVVTTQALIWGYGYPQSWAFYLSRLPQCAILCGVEIVVLIALMKPYEYFKKQFDLLSGKE